MTDRVEAAYRRIHPRLWRALLAFAGDGEVASDAEAEAFSQALGRGDAIRDVEAWVWRAAFRIAGGLLAGRRADERLPAEIVAVSDGPVVELLSQLHALSAQQRAVIVLRYVGRFTPAEIAGLLDTTPGTVRVQLHRAHATLRATLERNDGHR